MKSPRKMSNYDYFLKVDTSPYKGEWVAIAKSQIIAHGKDAQKVYQQAQKKGVKKDISLAKVPSQQILVLKLNLIKKLNTLVALEALYL